VDHCGLLDDQAVLDQLPDVLPWGFERKRGNNVRFEGQAEKQQTAGKKESEAARVSAALLLCMGRADVCWGRCRSCCGAGKLMLM
jgi:hypothetical protein